MQTKKDQDLALNKMPKIIADGSCTISYISS